MSDVLIRRALYRLGITARHPTPANWLALNPPTWEWPTWSVRYRPFDQEVDG